MKIISLIIAISALFFYSPILANELQDRKTIKNRVVSLFMQERFGELNKLAEDYLSNASRTSSGIWKSTLFNAGIMQVSNTKIKDEMYWSDITDKSLRWLTKNPDSPFAYNAHAQILAEHAWKFRGSSFAKDVKPENWEPFYEYLKKANTYLSQHKVVASRDPNWYVIMLQVSIGEHWNFIDFNQLVDEALRKFPNYYQIYFNAINYLIPRWHGRKDQIEQFANAAVNRTLNSEGMGMYARIYWFASQMHYGISLFSESDVVWEKMKRGIDDVLSRYPDQWNINNFALFACLAGDRSKTRELISKMEMPPIVSVWRSISNFNKCQTLALR